MKAMCVDISYNHYNTCTITEGRIYDYLESEKNCFNNDRKCIDIIDNFGDTREYAKACFVCIKLAIERKNKIDAILL